MKTRDRLFAWVLIGGVSATLAVYGIMPAHDGDPLTPAVNAVCAAAGIAIALDLSARTLWKALPAAAAPVLFGNLGNLVVWVAGALVLMTLIRGDDGAAKSGFLPRRLLMRRVMDANFPDGRAHLALKHGFAGAFDELRPAVAPIASLPPSVSLPLLSRLSLSTDSITRLTARKRMELIIAALKEESEKQTPARSPRHASIRMRKAEILLLLATWGSSDPDERKARLEESAALAFVAADDFPGNDAYNALAAGASSRVGERRAAARLLARIRDPRKAWIVGRLVRLCTRMVPERVHGVTRPAQIKTIGGAA